jgi:hypothetical protein
MLKGEPADGALLSARGSGYSPTKIMAAVNVRVVIENAGSTRAARPIDPATARRLEIKTVTHRRLGCVDDCRWPSRLRAQHVHEDTSQKLSLRRPMV